MSAHVMSRDEIQSLVALAAYGPTGRTICPDNAWGGYFTYLVPGPRSDWQARRREVRACDESADVLGQLLTDTNVESVAYRYPRDTNETLPGAYEVAPDGSERGDWLTPFTFNVTTRAPDIIDGLALIQSYEYQACEHEAWDTSEAREFCESLRRSLCSALISDRQSA